MLAPYLAKTIFILLVSVLVGILSVRSTRRILAFFRYTNSSRLFKISLISLTAISAVTAINIFLYFFPILAEFIFPENFPTRDLATYLNGQMLIDRAPYCWGFGLAFWIVAWVLARKRKNAEFLEIAQAVQGGVIILWAILFLLQPWIGRESVFNLSAVSRPVGKIVYSHQG